jgi:hypothetical protein
MTEKQRTSEWLMASVTERDVLWFIMTLTVLGAVVMIGGV